ncbi:MAG: F0F1 ATP synthase subunit A [Candidatus Margulisbacteria bacterium]|nr:F0F1 ATP synthase subunit A [Candidatus Margulisiibacteriota bacterium]
MINFILHELAVLAKIFHVTSDVLLLFIPVILIALLGTAKFEIIPNKIQSIFEVIYEFLESQMRVLFQTNKDYKNWMPFFLCLFFYILIHNLLGVIPQNHALTSNILITGSLACLVIFVSIWIGIRKKGFLGFFVGLTPSGVAWPIRLLLFPIELISIISKAFSLSVRLAANMFAGHMVIVILISLTEIFKSAFVVPLDIVVITIMLFFEIMVSFIQAFIFAYLSAIYVTDTMYEGH